MALKTIRVDNISGKTLEDDNYNTYTFAFQGKSYAVDVSGESEEWFVDTMNRLIEVASPVDTAAKSRSRKASATDRQLNRTIRKWAKEQGLDVADRGALSKEIVAKYHEAHS